MSKKKKNLSEIVFVFSFSLSCLLGKEVETLKENNDDGNENGDEDEYNFEGDDKSDNNKK